MPSLQKIKICSTIHYLNNLYSTTFFEKIPIVADPRFWKLARTASVCTTGSKLSTQFLPWGTRTVEESYTFTPILVRKSPWKYSDFIQKASRIILKPLENSQNSDLCCDQLRRNRHPLFSLIFLDSSCRKHSLLFILIRF